MKQRSRTVVATAALLLGSCSSTPDLTSGTLRCANAWEAGSYIGLFSFEAGELQFPPVDAGQVDMVYYFDGDDCSQGALIGHQERLGYLFPIGRRPWSELVQLEPPAEHAESVVAIFPLTKDKEGLAFWVRRGTGEYVLARLRAVQPASHSDLVSGTTPKVELEWLPPR